MRHSSRATFHFLKKIVRHLSLGSIGERAASRWYTSRGAHVLSRNWRDRWGEIDLIVQNERTITFVEVKTRRRDLTGDFRGEAAFDEKKKERIERAALRFIRRNRKVLTYHRIHSLNFALVVVLYEHAGIPTFIRTHSIQNQEGESYRIRAWHPARTKTSFLTRPLHT